MSNRPTASVARVVQGEIVDNASRAHPQDTLAHAARELNDSAGASQFLLPREKRQIARRLRNQRLAQAADLSVSRLNHEANAKISEIELTAAQQRAEILSAENRVMGALKHEQTGLAAKAMRSEISAENARQERLKKCDCLEEDREMLGQLFQSRSLANIRHIANEHGVHASPLAPTDEEQSS